MDATWHIEVGFAVGDATTRADAVLRLPGRTLDGWGEARRDPDDLAVPLIGEEVAAARALIRLGHQLLGAAEQQIEAIEEHPVRIRV